MPREANARLEALKGAMSMDGFLWKGPLGKKNAFFFIKAVGKEKFPFFSPVHLPPRQAKLGCANLDPKPSNAEKAIQRLLKEC